MTIDDLLSEIQSRLRFEAEAEHEILEEIRGHLEEAVAAAMARGLDQQQALWEVATAFAVEQAAAELRATHAGWGTLDGVAAAALPVIFALVLRWLIFGPDARAGDPKQRFADHQERVARQRGNQSRCLGVPRQRLSSDYEPRGV